MRLLVLGGTSFVGRHLVEAALDGGHEVTLFNRGATNPGLFEGCERRLGDREQGDYRSLTDGAWDAVIDVNAYYPRAVREAVAALEGRVGHYTFVSTVSVYVIAGAEPVDEATEPATVDDPTTEVVDNETYGGLKVLCEAEVASAFPGRCTIVRPGIVAGPHDPSDRFTYWVRRVARGGTVVAPARPDQPVQVVHARDLGDFTVAATIEGLPGPFNAVGPTEPLTLAGMIEACAMAAGRHDIEVAWVDEAVLREHQVRLPLHVPSQANLDGIFRCSPDRAVAAGLSNRPIVETAADTLAWDRTRGDTAMDGPPTPEQETALLEAWTNR